jgi:hypothetical protein
MKLYVDWLASARYRFRKIASCQHVGDISKTGQTVISGSLIGIVVAAVAMILLGYFFSFVGPQNLRIADPSIAEIILPNLVGVHPEPGDRFLFVALGLAGPLVLFGAARLATRLRGECRDARPIFYSLMLFALLVCLLKGAVLDASKFLIAQWPLLTIGSALFAYVLILAPASDQKVVKWISVATALVISAILIPALRIWSADSVSYHALFTSHYDAAVSSIVRIAAGGTCLADVVPQYGCYGEFIAPALKLFGTSTTTITAVFALMQISAMWATLLFAARLLELPATRVGCLVSLVIATGFNLTWWYFDPYLQYFPLRFFPPAISLLLVVRYQAAPGGLPAFALGAFSGFSIWWNFETGLAVVLSLAFFIAAGNFTAYPWRDRSKMLKATVRLLLFAFGAAASVGIFSAYLWLKASSPLNFANFFLFQKVFYLTGFAMIPIPAFPDYWAVHAAIIFCVLLYATLWSAFGSPDRDKKLELAAYLAILGAGLFVYYSGRSHPLVLRLVAWPSVILFFFMLERCSLDISKSVDRVVVRAVTALAIVLPTVFFLQALPQLGTLAGLYYHNPPKDPAVAEDVAFIASHIGPHEPAAIVAVNQATLYGETGAKPALEGPSVAEMIRREDLALQTEMLIRHGPEKLFIGTKLYRAAEDSLLGTSIPVDLKLIGTAYAFSRWGPGCRLMFFQRKASNGSESRVTTETAGSACPSTYP